METEIQTRLLNAREGAKYLNLSYAYFCQLLREKKIKHYKPGKKKILVEISDIEKYLESITINPEPKININANLKNKYHRPNKYNIADVKAHLGIKK